MNTIKSFSNVSIKLNASFATWLMDQYMGNEFERADCKESRWSRELSAF